MSYFVYVLKSEISSRFYRGISKDVEKRLKEHNSGKTKSTRAYCPWKVVYVEEYTDRISAREREKFLKTGKGRDYIESLL